MMLEVMGYLLIVLAAYTGWKLRLLSASGAVAAGAVGFVIFMSYSYTGLILLGAFFGSSSFWSIFKREHKDDAHDKNAKTERRDWTQVLANGGAAAIAASLGIYFNHEIFFIAFAAALAAANADTWASEIGVLSRRQPFHLLRLRQVETGTSGAVSLLGLAASLGGAVFIALVAGLFSEAFDLAAFFLVCLLGFSGSVMDTLLGASMQIYYKCKICGKETEKLAHCGHSTTKLGGIRFMNNEMVNFLSSFAAALFVYILYKASLFQ